MPWHSSSSSFSSSRGGPNTLRLRTSGSPSSSSFLLLGVGLLLIASSLTAYAAIRTYGGFLHHSTEKERALEASQLEADDSSTHFAKWNASDISQNDRGWLLDPVSTAARSGIAGGATECKAVHVGQIRPGAKRGNHRHLVANETLIIWGADTKFRLEYPTVKQGYVELVILAEEVAIIGGSAGLAHAVVNIDTDKTTYFLGCQDALVDPENPQTNYGIWSNL